MKISIVKNWKPHLQSPLKDIIVKYIEYKEALGYKLTQIIRLMLKLDHLVASLNIDGIFLPDEVSQEWSKLQDNENVNTRYKRMVYLRDFAKFAQLNGVDAKLPKVPKCNRRSYTPYIFSKEEIERIFFHCDRLHVHRKYYDCSKFVMPTLIRLLYGSGMRIGECLDLKNNDVKLAEGIVILRNTKNKAERMVPLSISVREVLKDYVSAKERFGLSSSGDDPFFVSPMGQRVLPASVRGHFKAVLTRAKISHTQSIRVHDLRHTFCVHALANMSMQGMDIYVCLPLLMQYVGHKTIAATNYYVRLTADRYPNILKSMEEYGCVFPDIDNPENL